MDNHETLADLLGRAGWQTAAFYPPAVFYIEHDRFAGYDARHLGFTYVQDHYEQEATDAAQRTDEVLAYLAGENPARTFTWVHFFGPHEPYTPHDGFSFGDRPVDIYDGEIAYADAEIGRLVDAIKKQRPEAIIVVTADHGEEFGEHGGAYHGTTLYDEQVRVPLIVYVPHQTPRRVHPPVSLVDVAPTLLTLVGRPVPARMRGSDLTPWMSAHPPADDTAPPVFAEVGPDKMAVSGDEKLLCDAELGYCRLYALGGPERDDLAAARPERATALRQALDAWETGLTTYERDPLGPAAAARRATLEQGALGDREALPELGKILADQTAEQAERVAAARAIAHLTSRHADVPPAVHDALAGSRNDADPIVRAWALTALVTIGDEAAAAPLAALPAGGDAELAARSAIALGAAHRPEATDRLIAALAATTDETLREELVLALGRTHDTRATVAIVDQYADVRTRRFAAIALGEVGDPDAVPYLVERLGDETYTTTRASVARSLGRLRDARALPGLEARLATETDPEVIEEIVWALAHLGKGVGPPFGKVTAPTPSDTLWIVVDAPPSEPITVTIAGAKQSVDTTHARDAYPIKLDAPVTTLDVKVEGEVARLFLGAGRP
jgi:HEAT repeat protein